VIEARSPLICVLHADTILPDDAVAVIRATMQDPRIALAGFVSLIAGAEQVRWGTTFHNWIKTWYAPLIFRPHLFVRGGRLLFGDQAMFFRRSDFLAVGGCDETLRGRDANEVERARISILARNKRSVTGRIQKRKTYHLQIVTFGLQRAAGPYRGAIWRTSCCSAASLDHPQSLYSC
jgi:hypothetical protein